MLTSCGPVKVRWSRAVVPSRRGCVVLCTRGVRRGAVMEGLGIQEGGVVCTLGQMGLLMSN